MRFLWFISAVAIQSLLLVGCGGETHGWQYPVRSVEGLSVVVHVERKDPTYVGSRHTFVFLGDSSNDWTVQFEYGGKAYRWSGAFVPMLLSLSSGRHPILGVVSGERTDFGASHAVRLYELGSKESRAIAIVDYPHDVVIPNLGGGSWINPGNYVTDAAMSRFPEGMHRHLGTPLVALWQAICRISDADLPFPERIDAACIERLKGDATKQRQRSNTPTPESRS